MTEPFPACGAIALGRSTFDIDFGQRVFCRVDSRLRSLNPASQTFPTLIMDPADVGPAVRSFDGSQQLIVVAFATFTDSRLLTAVLEATDEPLLLWGFPELQTGEKLRLNSLTARNLAGYLLGRKNRPFRYLYADPDDDRVLERLAETIARPPVTPAPLVPPRSPSDAQELDRWRIGVVGDPPDGFEPCETDRSTQGWVRTEPLELDRLFDHARTAPASDVADRVAEVKVSLRGADQLDQGALQQSIRLELGLRSLVEENSWDGVAVRCWPECFTTFGAACCGPIGSLTNDGVAASCEADALGVATSLLLQNAAGRPAFVADMVNLDTRTDTGVFWHCGSAPLSLADPSGPIEAAAHSNRHLPLIHQFGFAPGPLTIARISQSRGGLRLLIGKGEVVAGDRPFAGTCGVIRFETPAEDVLATMMSEGLEHHYVVVAGDVTAELRRFAERVGWDTIDL